MGHSSGGCCGSDASSGFTLLEILVVVAVLGLLVLGLGRGVHVGLALWDAQQERVHEIAELDAGTRILRSLLTGIAPAAGTAGTAANQTFNGDSEQLRFIGDLPTGLGSTRRANIRIVLHNRALVLSWTPHRHEIALDNTAPTPIDTELVANVADLDIAYWGSSSPDQSPAWQTRWVGPIPPGLVRIRIGFAKNDRRRWPDLIAAPLL